MDFFTNQWIPARRAAERRAFPSEFQYTEPTSQWRSSQPEFRYKEQAPERRAYQPAPAPELRRSPKVVQIPVRFVGEEENRSASALKIQKVFRGHLVRRSVRKIIGIKREVDAIEVKVSKKEVLDLIREKDGKERLRINESLMALLFILDAVNGCSDSGIRLCRKAVIRKAIALQEKVDTLANDRTSESDEKLEDEDPLESDLKSTESDQNHEESMPDSHEKDLKPADSDQTHEELMTDSVCKDDEELVEQNVAAVADVNGDGDASGAELKGDISSSTVEDEKEIGVVAEKPVSSGGEAGLVERVVEQNGKMMKMMAELFEKNEAQAKMLSSLTHRLEQLEKAYVCEKIDKLRRKKKKLSP